VSFVHGLELLVALISQKAFSCCDAILETDPAVSMKSELLVAREKLEQLLLLTVHVVPM
jgi:hypothetical protein